MNHEHLAALFAGLALCSASAFGFLLMRRRRSLYTGPSSAPSEQHYAPVDGMVDPYDLPGTELLP